MEQKKEPIAIIGMSCRLPGGASSPEKLWDILAIGTSAWSPVPKERFNLESFHDPANVHATTTNTAGAHFLSQDVKTFDAQFFNINPAEANAVDPQQRFMLELAYEAFENAGLSLPSLRGSNTGVYVGQWCSDYAEILARDPEYPALYHTLGAGPAITSNRVSYFFDLKGPSFTIDTGCSASLVAVNSAVQSLRLGETDVALVGGVNLLLDPQRFTYQSKLKMFSGQGRSFSFDHRANGYGRGEGCCAVVLKPLSCALRDGDNIRAVIRNAVANQDGRTPGIAEPSGSAQEAAIRKAFGGAGLPLEVDYVEAHGTGTALGDPIEAAAIAAAFAGNKGEDTAKVLPIGSIKANIGHTESCAGLAGLIKAVLMLEKDMIPPHINYERPNEKLRLHEWNIRIPLELERRALSRISVNSFGYGGTNAHVVLEKGALYQAYSATNGHAGANASHGQNGHYQMNNGSIGARNGMNGTNGSSQTNGHSYNHGPPPAENLVSLKEAIPLRKSARVRAFIVSGATEQTCRDTSLQLAHYIERNRVTVTEEWLDRAAYTLSKRTIHRKAAIVTASSTEQLFVKMEALSVARTFLANTSHDGGGTGDIKFVFTGQGAQYHGMAWELLGAWPVFTQSLLRASQALNGLDCEWDLFDELSKGAKETRVGSPGYGQPLTTAIQMALVDALEALGVKPSFVIGHSSGEIAAAYAAGLLSFGDAIRVSYHRGRLTDKLLASGADQGSMLAVGKQPSVVEDYIKDLGPVHQDKVVIACYNSPSSVTVSGCAKAVDMLAEKLEEDSVFHRKVRTNGAAYHSCLMDSIAEDYLKAMQGIVPRSTSTVQMISSVSGLDVGKAMLGPAYWVRNLVSPVKFTDALAHLESTNPGGVILEIGPHTTLKGPVEQTLQALKLKSGSHSSYMGTLIRNSNAEASVLECLGRLFLAGYKVMLPLVNNGFDEGPPRMLVDLPSYQFDHTTEYWHESRLSRDFRSRPFLPHELIGTSAADFNTLEPRWRRFLRLRDMPWLRGHQVQGQVVFPAAGYLTMALEAIRQLKTIQNPTAVVGSFQFRNISIRKALLITDGKADLEVSISLRLETRTNKASSDQWMEFRISSFTESQGWAEHCRGLVHAASSSSEINAPAQLSNGHSEIRRRMRPLKFYYLWRYMGLDWHDAFASLVDIRSGAKSCFTTIQVPLIDDPQHNSKVKRQDTYLIHPTVLDACLFHGLCALLLFEEKADSAVVPTFIKSLEISGQISSVVGSKMYCEASRAIEGQQFNVTIRQNGNMDVHSVEKSDQPIVMRAEGITTRKLPGELSVSSATDRQLCHQVSQVTYCSAITHDHLRSLCRARVVESSVPKDEKHAEAASLHFIKAAVATTTPEQVPDPSRRHWLSWMQHAAARTLDTEFDEQLVEESGLLGKIIASIGPRLHCMLTEAADPLTFFTDANLWSQIYRDERCRRCYTQISGFVAELGRQKPGLRVLEIGGGTASASLPILSSTQYRGRNLIVQYDFTDISTGFFEPAKTYLSDYSSIVNYRVLDIERDVTSQGFEQGSYDLVVACNVIHATPSIDKSLANAKKLLRPDGYLVLMETTKDLLSYGLLFGAFAGWWAGVDEGRRLSPLLSRDAWVNKLANDGFENIGEPLADYYDDQSSTLSVFLARVPNRAGNMSGLPITFLHAGQAADDSYVTQLSKDVGTCLETRQILSVCDISMPAPNHGGIVIFSPGMSLWLTTDISVEGWNSFKAHLLGAKACLFITIGGTSYNLPPWGGLMTGFLRCVRLEHPEIRLVSLDLDPGSGCEPLYNSSAVIASVLQSPSFDLEADPSGIETEFSESNGQLFVTRVLHDPDLDAQLGHTEIQGGATSMTPFFDPSRDLQAELAVPGLLQTLRWRDMTPTPPLLGQDQVRLELRAASINFKDVLIAAGQLEGVTEMRNDCSGVVVQVGAGVAAERFKVGDRVCAYLSQSYNNYPVVPVDCCALIPDGLGFEDAASLPIVWGTVYYSLVTKADLQKSDTILIHSGAGAVGQAAIELSQYIGAEVYVTAGSDEKRGFIAERNGIPEDHIMSSRDTSFAGRLRDKTHGRGVDVILNSLSGEMFRESCNCMAQFGRFIEIGRKDFLDDALIPSKFLLDNISFMLVDMAQIIEVNRSLAKQILDDVVRLAASGTVRRIPITTMPISEIESAFRTIQAGKHIGKIVLTVEEGQMVKAAEPCSPQAKLRGDGLYIVAGGFGGLGRTIIEWLAGRGARRIVVAARSVLDTDKEDFISDVRNRYGATVFYRICDIGKTGDVERMMASLTSEGRVCGLIQSAMSLQDCVFDDMTSNQWNRALAPKVAGTWNLHNALPHDLDFFVTLSSGVAITGNVGQSNYAGACSFQDALARHRRQLGLAAYSINVSAVLESGFVSENPDVAANLRRHGLGSLTTSELLGMINHAVLHSHDTPEDCQRAIGLLPSGTEHEWQQSEWLSDIKFRHLTSSGSIRTSSSSSDGSFNVTEALREAGTESEIHNVVSYAIMHQLSKLIAMPVDKMSAGQSLDEFGVDSLVAVELRNWIMAYLQASLPLLVIREAQSFQNLAKLVIGESRVVQSLKSR